MARQQEGSARAAPGGVDEPRLYAKVGWRLLPLIFICYLAAYVDRVNVGFAKLQMLEDLNFSETAYGFGAGIFFLGYVLFEVPSNMATYKVGARIWIARIMLSWAVISGITAFVASPLQFYILRFLLGVAEAGFIPAVLLYLTYWWPDARRGQVTAIFLAAIPMSGIVGGPISGTILSAMSGVGGLAAWQWLFLIEAVPSIVLGIVVLLALPDRPQEARWLSPDETARLQANLDADSRTKQSTHSYLDALKRVEVWILSVIYIAIAMGIYVLSFWLPSLIENSGVKSPVAIGWLTALAYLCSIAAMVLVCRSADRRRTRRAHTAVCCGVCVLGLLTTAGFADSPVIVFLGLICATAGASAALAAFWALPAAFLGGAGAAVGIALVNSVGNVGGFFSTFVVGWLSDLTASTGPGLLVVAACIALAAPVLFVIPAALVDK